VSRIVHLSTAHGRSELRVHLKECNSLSVKGYDVHYIVADGQGEERIGDVQVHDIGVLKGRFGRMIMQPWRMLARAWQVNGLLYHFHDPELLLIALFLLKGGAKVIYDSHEDVPRSILSREWIPLWIRTPVSATFEVFENFVARRISAIVGATPHIARRFEKLNSCSIAVNNYPLRSEINDAVNRSYATRNVCYLGGISRPRGIVEMVRALEYVDSRLIIAGTFESAELEAYVRSLPGWAKVDFRGQVSRDEVQEIMAQSQAGLIFFLPEPNHVFAQPNKMFEYMSAGLPVLASDFPLWRELLVESEAGLVANPANPKDIAKVINDLLDDNTAIVRMGKNGRDAVLMRYLWTYEEKKLFDLYRKLLN
jgi:glycosyltransferase involved in cell wall biosynthesis